MIAPAIHVALEERSEAHEEEIHGKGHREAELDDGLEDEGGVEGLAVAKLVPHLLDHGLLAEGLVSAAVAVTAVDNVGKEEVVESAHLYATIRGPAQ